jgi:hypothetical protein
LFLREKEKSPAGHPIKKIVFKPKAARRPFFSEAGAFRPRLADKRASFFYGLFFRSLIFWPWYFNFKLLSFNLWDFNFKF